MLFRVLINLLSNAIKYSPEGTRVECSIEALGGDWQCAIADQGHGIPAADLPRLFDRFERLEAARRRGSVRGERANPAGLAFCVPATGGGLTVPEGGGSFA